MWSAFLFLCLYIMSKVNGGSDFISETPTVTLYSDKKCQARNLTLEGSYEYSLSSMKFDNKAKSVQMAGAWIFYEQDYFNSYTEGQVFWSYSEDPEKCLTLPKLRGRISSLRFAGVPWHYKDESLVVYELEEFQGDEVRMERDTWELDLEHQASLIITGPWPWTLYEEPGYTGASVCLKPPEDGAPLFISEELYSRVPFELIRSVRLGCHK